MLNEMTKRSVSQGEAFEFFDSLETVETKEMWGLWKGEEIQTGHPFEGMLTAANWYGKKFVDEEHVYPLIFEKGNGNLFAGNPGVMPLSLPLEKIPNKIMSPAMKIFRPFFNTKKSAARLRQVEFRGKVSSAMIYDQKSIIDVFRKVDDDTLFGVMDIKNRPNDKSYFFILRKVNGDFKV